MPSEVSSIPPPRVMWFIIGIGAILASQIATALSMAFLVSRSGNIVIAPAFFFVAAGLFGLLIGLVFWWFALVKPRRATIVRGALCGALSGLIAHTFVWGSVLLTLPWEQGFQPGMLLELLLSLVVETARLSLFSLLYAGWITALVGGISGALLIALQHGLTTRSLSEGS